MKQKKALLILLTLPILILIGSYGITKILNIGTGGDKKFSVALDQDIMFPWEDQIKATIHLDFSQEKTSAPMGKTNIVLIIDNSRSMDWMTGEITKIEAAKDAVVNFIDNFSGGASVSMGVIFFDLGITNQFPLTNDIKGLREMITAYNSSGGGTNFTPALSLAAQWLENRKNEKNHVIFLTDGGADTIEPNRLYQDHFLKNQVNVYMVGVGQDADYQALRDIISDSENNFDPNRVLTCDDPIKIQVLFDQVGQEIGNVAGKQGEMFLPFAHKVFSWDKKVDPELKKKATDGRFIYPPGTRQNPIRMPYQIVFARQYQEHMALTPSTCGIIKPFYDPLQFSFIDLQNTSRLMESNRAPYLLNITYGLLFWLFLPALLLWLYTLMGRIKQEIPREAKIHFPYKKLETPGILPLQFVQDKATQEWIPTLVIGLGRTGRHVLTHLKQNLADAVNGAENAIQFLSIDVVAAEVDGPTPDRVPGTITRLDRDSEIYIPDPHLRNVKDKIDTYKNTTTIDPENPYSSLSLEEYTTLPENIMGLSTGSQRNAALVRAYLFKELEQGEHSKLMILLRQKLQQLQQSALPTQFMQVILVGNTNGGVGSGLIAPLSVLLHRWTHKIATTGQSVEINLVLVEDQQDHQNPKIVPIQNSVLRDELDLLSQAGRVSFPYNLVPPSAWDKEQLLRGLVVQRPYHNAYVFALNTKQPALDLFSQVGDSLLFLIERTARKESRNLLEGVKKQEGTQRKKEKIEVFSHITSRSLIYPASLIKEMLELFFINDIWSDKISLPGLSSNAGSPELEERGTLEELLTHPLVKPIMNMEMGRENNKWTALLLGKGEDLKRYNTSLSEDTENFWGFLEKAIPLLLNQGAFSLTGLMSVLQEIQDKLRSVPADILSPEEIQDAQVTSAFIQILQQDIEQWYHLLLGTKNEKNDPGLLGTLQTKIGEMETLKKELLSMKKCRLVLGLDKDTPDAYSPDSLRKQWLAKWLDLQDQNLVYPELKKRCLWKIVEKGLKKPELQFEFYGDKPYTFRIGPDFQKNFSQETRQLAAQFLLHLKEITILELLMEYEKKTPQTYSKTQLAKRLHADFETDNLYYLYLFPHSSCIRLSASEETYLKEFKKSLQETQRVEEVAAYPPTSNQYRLFSIQVSTLLKGNPQNSWEKVKPLHMTEKLKQETQRLIETRFGFQVEPLLPLHYLVFYYPQHFKSFVGLWLGAKIVRDEYDQLWKLQAENQTIPLTLFPDEGLQEAAIRYVLNIAPMTLPPQHVPPQQDRLNQLEEEVYQRHPFYCWMKCYMEENQ